MAKAAKPSITIEFAEFSLIGFWNLISIKAKGSGMVETKIRFRGWYFPYRSMFCAAQEKSEVGSYPMKMSRFHQSNALNFVVVGAVCAAAWLLLLPTTGAAQSPAKSPTSQTQRMSVVVPLIDAARGRRLFVTKGCFICHSVKGVGGKAAPPLDAKPGSRSLDVLGFVARMWKGAPLMFELQSMEMGYRIELNRDEIADLAGFVGDPKAQEGFAQGDIPEVVRDWMVNQAWWLDPSLKLGDLLPEKFPDLENDK